MSDEAQGNQNINADQNGIAVGSIKVDGNVRDIIIGHGLTAEQVSTLLMQISTTFQPKPFDGHSPYKGLDFFGEEDAELFFGREKLVEDLVSRLQEKIKEKEPRTLFVTGPSGSGKSSLVRAGLIHALKQRSVENSKRWLFGTMRPGREPIAEMARVTAKLAKSTNAEDEICAKAPVDPTIFRRWCEIALGDGREERVVFFIDQFEEVFTQVSEEKANTFIDLLDNAVAGENDRIILLFALRSDFISNCTLYPKLNALFNRQNVQIGGMQPEELVSAIAQPALRVGLRIDPDLIAQIINDMQGEPGALPLMQFALKDLFDAGQEKGGIIALTLNDYLQRGGIRKALERHADNSFKGLDEHEKELARSIFSRLIEIGRGTQDTRRTAIFDELVPASANSEEVEAIIHKLADARLITTDEISGRDTVTISHEKLIDAWPWLKKLVNENRDVIALQNEIDKDAEEWVEHRRDASYLYSGARLINAREKLKEKRLALSETADEFIQASFRRKQRAQLTKILTITGVVLFIMAGITLVSYLSATNAKKLAEQSRYAASTQAVIASTAQAASNLAAVNEERAKNQAQVDRQVAQVVSLRDRNFLVSLLLAVETFRGTEGLLNRDLVQSALLDDAKSNPQLKYFLNGHAGPVVSVAFSPDGKTIASGSMDDTIILWDVETRKPIGKPLNRHSDDIRSVAFSQDGKMLASASEDKTIILWNTRTGNPIGWPLSGHTGLVTSVAFSPDGKILASGSNDKTIILWDVKTHKPIGQPFIGHTAPIYSVAFSPDGKTLASGSGDNTIILWNLETHQPIGQPLRRDVGPVPDTLPAPILSVAFSPDGKTLASGSVDQTIILWDVESRQPIGQPLKGHTDSVRSVAFSRDGKMLASGSYDRTIILWDVESRQPIGQPLKGHSEIINSVAFSPDGKTLVSGSGDGTIGLWDVESRPPLGQPLNGHAGPINSVVFSPDGKTLASGSLDQTILLWDIETNQPIGQPLLGHTGPVFSVAYSPDGKMLASGGGDNNVILWNLETHQPIGLPLSGHTGPVSSVAFSPDGKMLASGSGDNTIILWNLETHQPIGLPLSGHTGPITSVAFSPDGKTLASGSEDKTIILWNVKSQTPIGRPLREHAALVTTVAFSPDGKMLASGSKDDTIILWDVESRKPIGRPLSEHKDLITAVAFSPDGKTLASGSYDQSTIVWDVDTRQPIGEPFKGQFAPVLSVAFRPDGKMLASSSHNIILWDSNPESWLERSCQRAGRNLTRGEWESYFPGKEYQEICPQFPLEPVATPTTP